MARTRANELNRVQKTPKFLVEVPAHEEESIARCLAAIDICLRRRNPEEAIAWIDRHFQSEQPATWESSVGELNLSPRLINSLQGAEIETAEDLRCAIGAGRLREIPNVGPVEILKCIRAVEGIGKVASDWVI